LAGLLLIVLLLSPVIKLIHYQYPVRTAHTNVTPVTARRFEQCFH